MQPDLYVTWDESEWSNDDQETRCWGLIRHANPLAVVSIWKIITILGIDSGLGWKATIYRISVLKIFILRNG